MLLTALAVPLLIGAEQYGKYAAVFAVPAFLQSTIEAFAVLRLHAGPTNRGFWHAYIGLSVAALAISGLIYRYIFGLDVALWAIVLGCALLFRSLCSALVYTDERVQYVRISVLAEGVTFFSYALVLAFAYLSGSLNYTTPLFMIVLGAFISGSFVLWWYLRATDGVPTNRPQGGEPPTALSLRMLMSRSYEDFSLTLMPLFLATSFGLAVAGEFRIIVSGMKVVSKLFPFRYETILRGIRAGEFNAVLFAKISLLFIALGGIVAVFLFFLRGHLFLAEDTPLWSIGFATGFLVASLAAFPAAAVYSRSAIVLSTFSAALTCLAIGMGSLTGFVGLFITMTVVTYLAIVHTLIYRREGASAGQ